MISVNKSYSNNDFWSCIWKLWTQQIKWPFLIFLQLPRTKTFATLHQWLHWQYFIQERRTQPNYYLSQFFLLALKYTWEISKNLFAFLDIKLSINNRSLSNNLHYKPTDPYNYLPHSSSHPQHIKNAIPFSQFLRLRHLGKKS